MQRAVQSAPTSDLPTAAELCNHPEPAHNLEESESSFLDPLFVGLTNFAMKLAGRIEAEEGENRTAG